MNSRPCNYCMVEQMRVHAEEENKRIETRTFSSGVAVFALRPDETLPEEMPEREMLHMRSPKALLSHLPLTCVCSPRRKYVRS